MLYTRDLSEKQNTGMLLLTWVWYLGTVLAVSCHRSPPPKDLKSRLKYMFHRTLHDSPEARPSLDCPPDFPDCPEFFLYLLCALDVFVCYKIRARVLDNVTLSLATKPRRRKPQH